MTDATKRIIAERGSEFLREAAVLIAVFLPLVWFLELKNELTREWILITVMLSIGLWISGVMLEVIMGE
jgi:hypothetical protein